MDKNCLLELYKTIVTEHRVCGEDHHKRVVWFISILSALGTATVAGFFKASTYYHDLILLAGPAGMIGVCWIARRGTERIYQRFLECVTFRAKLEYRLRLMDKPQEAGGPALLPCFEKEAMIPTRHIRCFEDKQPDDRDTDGTEAWVEANKKRGYQALVDRLFTGCTLVSYFLAAIIVAKAVVDFLSSL